MSEKIVIIIDQRNKVSVNLVNDVRMVSGKKGFTNPVKAYDYVAQLQSQGHTVINESVYQDLTNMRNRWVQFS